MTQWKPRPPILHVYGAPKKRPVVSWVIIALAGTAIGFGVVWLLVGR